MRYILLTAVALMCLQVLAKETISINTDMPNEFVKGKSREVRFEINKADLSTFAYFELEFPANFEVENIENAGADFDFDDGKLKFTWIKLAQNPLLVLRFKVSTTEDSCGTFLVKGRFGYLEKNKRGAIELPPLRIVYGSEAKIATCRQPVGQENNITRIEVRREKPMLQSFDNSYNVILMVSNQSKLFDTNFVIEETLPDGFTVEGIQTAGATVAKLKNKITFTWAKIPAQERFMVVYKVKKQAKTKNQLVLNGKYTFKDGKKPNTQFIENFKDIDTELNQLQQQKNNQNKPIGQPDDRQKPSGGAPAQRDLNQTQQDFKSVLNR